MITVEQVRKVRDHFLAGYRCQGVMSTAPWPISNDQRHQIFDGQCCLVGGLIGADEQIDLSKMAEGSWLSGRKVNEINEYLKKYLHGYWPEFFDLPFRRYQYSPDMLAFSFNDYFNTDEKIIDFLNWLETYLVKEQSNGSAGTLSSVG